MNRITNGSGRILGYGQGLGPGQKGASPELCPPQNGIVLREDSGVAEHVGSTFDKLLGFTGELTTFTIKVDTRSILLIGGVAAGVAVISAVARAALKK